MTTGLRYGIVSDRDADAGLVKVHFDDDDFTTGWLSTVTHGTKDDKFYKLPDIGEQVACLMDKHAETGVVLGSVYSGKDKPPQGVFGEDIAGVKFSDGTTVLYNRDSGRLEIKVGQTVVNIDKTNGITIKKGTNSLKAQLNQLFTQLQAETHPSAMGPTSPPANSPAYAAINSIINLIFEE